MNALMSSGESSNDTPMTARRWSLYFSANSTRNGVSALQGGHQVAQKLSRMGRPLNEASETSRPLVSLSVKLRLATVPAGADALPSSMAQAGQIATSAATATARSQRLFHTFRTAAG